MASRQRQHTQWLQSSLTPYDKFYNGLVEDDVTECLFILIDLIRDGVNASLLGFKQ